MYGAYCWKYLDKYKILSLNSTVVLVIPNFTMGQKEPKRANACHSVTPSSSLSVPPFSSSSSLHLRDLMNIRIFMSRNSQQCQSHYKAHKLYLKNVGNTRKNMYLFLSGESVEQLL